MPVGQRLRVCHIQCRSGYHALSQSCDQIVCDHMLTPRHIHQPSMIRHRLQGIRVDNATRLIGQSQGKHHSIG